LIPSCSGLATPLLLIPRSRYKHPEHGRQRHPGSRDSAHDKAQARGCSKRRARSVAFFPDNVTKANCLTSHTFCFSAAPHLLPIPQFLVNLFYNVVVQNDNDIFELFYDRYISREVKA
jgi:hypothetical protein